MRRPRIATVVLAACMTVAAGCRAPEPRTSPVARDAREPAAAVTEARAPGRLVVLATGDAELTLVDPSGGINAVRDTGEVNTIPGCTRVADWTDPEAGDDSTGAGVTAFEIDRPLPGRYLVTAEARAAGVVSLDVSANPMTGGACAGHASASLGPAARRTWSITLTSARDSCRVAIAPEPGGSPAGP